MQKTLEALPSFCPHSGSTNRVLSSLSVFLSPPAHAKRVLQEMPTKSVRLLRRRTSVFVERAQHSYLYVFFERRCQVSELRIRQRCANGANKCPKNFTFHHHLRAKFCGRSTFAKLKRLRFTSLRTVKNGAFEIFPIVVRDGRRSPLLRLAVLRVYRDTRVPWIPSTDVELPTV